MTKCLLSAVSRIFGRKMEALSRAALEMSAEGKQSAGIVTVVRKAFANLEDVRGF